MRFSRLILTVLLAAAPAAAQKPVGIGGHIGNWVDYYHAVTTTVQGDHEAFTAWASNSMLPQFPDPNGLPIVGLVNDGHVGNCAGNILLLQLSKLPTLFQVPSNANTLLTAYPNCFSSYGGAPGDTTPYGRHLWYGDTNTLGTWKGAVMAFRNNILLAPFYRQTSPGDRFGDSTMVLSPDAGRSWIDYSRYNTYSITAASCVGTTATLSVTGAAALTGDVYVHDVGPVYNGKHTVASANSSQITFAVPSCSGASGSTGGMGPLDVYGSAPPYAEGAMMWSSGGSNPMTLQTIINYGQDGNYPEGIEAACDPTVYVCGLAYNAALNPAPWSTVLYRVPVGQEMTKSAYQWYTCPGYSSRYPSIDVMCDGNQAGSWTNSLESATVLFYAGVNGLRAGGCNSIQYLPSHGSYLLGCGDVKDTTDGAPYRFAWMWAPHPWGPFYEITSSECAEFDTLHQGYCSPFSFLMNYQENIVSMNPPTTQLRFAMKGDWTPEGAPSFWGLEAAGGRVPWTGMSRRADYKGLVGQNGMGHRFVSDNMQGAISSQGKGTSGSYRLSWWADLWDHGGLTNRGTTDRPYFRDVMSGGAKYFNITAPAGNYFAQGAALLDNGVQLQVGCCGSTQLVSSFTDSTVSANSGNASWTYVAVFKVTSPSGTGVQNNYSRPLPLLTMGTGAANLGMQINIGRDIGGSGAGNIAVSWGQYQGATNPTIISTAPGTIVVNTWYFLAVTAKANASGFPTIQMYLGHSGTMAEFGGASLATAGTGTSAMGLTKTCASGTNCTATPAVTAGGFVVGSDGFQESLNGIYGEAGLYSGVVPGHVIREIYRTLQTDWTRMGRGTI